MKSLWIVVVVVVGVVSGQRSRQSSSNSRLSAPTTTPEPRFLALPDPGKFIYSWDWLLSILCDYQWFIA